MRFMIIDTREIIVNNHISEIIDFISGGTINNNNTRTVIQRMVKTPRAGILEFEPELLNRRNERKK